MSPTPIRTISPAAHVDPTAVIGHGCRIEAGAVVSAGCEVGDHVYIGANAVIGTPGQRQALSPRIGQHARVDAGAVVLNGVEVAAGAWVMPGAVVMRSVPHEAIVRGNPAEIVGYVDTPNAETGPAPLVRPDLDGGVASLHVSGVTVHHLKVVPDLRGNLTVGEFGRDIPFAPKRYFMVYGVPSREIRGEHAHRHCHQFLICVHGSCSVVVDDGRRRAEVLLDRMDLGVYLPPMTWGTQYRYSPDAVLLVFASDHYDPADYIRDYGEFRALCRAN